jgi:hypothetical protein
MLKAGYFPRKQITGSKIGVCMPCLVAYSLSSLNNPLDLGGVAAFCRGSHLKWTNHKPPLFFVLAHAGAAAAVFKTTLEERRKVTWQVNKRFRIKRIRQNVWNVIQGESCYGNASFDFQS